jgi:transposase
MKIDEATRKKFIELRAQGRTYREIQQDLNVSRPTIAKWCRMYARELDREYRRQRRKADRERIKELDREFRQRFSKFYEIIGKGR